MFNIFNFTKLIANPAKLDLDFRNHATFKTLYNYINTKGTSLTVHFKVNLTQAQMDELTVFINAYSDFSVFDTLYKYINSDVRPFTDRLLIELQAKNIELGITQMNKTTEVLGFFEHAVLLPSRTRAVSLKGAFDTNSLTVVLELLVYYRANSYLYSDLTPFITDARLVEIYNKIATFLNIPHIS
jgi:phosphoglycolate phosphatase-like HAD superfamily hydrolase